MFAISRYCSKASSAISLHLLQFYAWYYEWLFCALSISQPFCCFKRSSASQIKITLDYRRVLSPHIHQRHHEHCAESPSNCWQHVLNTSPSIVAWPRIVVTHCGATYCITGSSDAWSSQQNWVLVFSWHLHFRYSALALAIKRAQTRPASWMKRIFNI